MWKRGTAMQRVELRELALATLGHAPDPSQTWSELMDSMKTVTTPEERGPDMQLCCGECGTGAVQPVPPGLGMRDVDRRSILVQILKGTSNRQNERRFRDSMVFQSETLRVRTKLVPKLAIKWLRGRKDLLPYVCSLVGTAGMGAGAFCGYVAAVTASGPNTLHDALANKRCFTCCVNCALDSQKAFKVLVRFGTTDKPEMDGTIFDWQYAGHMLGRFEHEVFADKADLQTRVDYENTMPVRNGMFKHKAQFDKRYEEELRKEGRRFGYICAMARRTSGQDYHHLTEMALTAVPTGSVPAYGTSSLALEEIDKMHLNKKLAIIYFTKGEEEALKYGQMHAKSNWMWKLEIAKLRNLVPGTFGYYLSSARVSAYGEARFLGTLENVPLMWSEARKEKENALFMQWQDVGYVACRDYKNYNLCHKHERMQMFYDAAQDACRTLGEHEMADDYEHMARCLDDVGVFVDGTYNKWEYGLQTGWAHTMMFHCVHNSCAGRVAAQMIKEMTGWRRMVAGHQGDDSREVWSEPMAGPLAQAILDAGGQVGQYDKQHFAREKGSWAEFLRVWYKGSVTRGSALRLIGGFVSADSQHKPSEGGIEAIRTIVSSANGVWRRQGGRLGWRRSDLGAMLDYWSTSNRRFKDEGAVDWRAQLSERFGLALGMYPDMQWNAAGGRVVRRRRYDVEVGPHMLKRARRNLTVVGRVPKLGRYAAEYAKDMVASGVVQSYDLEDVEIATTAPCDGAGLTWAQNMMAHRGAARVVKRCLAGHGGWQDKDTFSVQMTVNHLFAGSESVARACVKDMSFFSVRGTENLRTNVARGLKLLAGTTSIDKSLCKQQFVCAEKYWAHIEILLREQDECVALQRWIGFLVADYAIAAGELI